MRILAPAVVASALFLATVALPVQAAPSFGVSLGAGLTNPANPAAVESYQPSSLLRFRWDVLTPYTEMMLGLSSRGQALDAARASVFETGGLALSAGAHLGFLRAGLTLEGAILRQIAQDSVPGTLRFHNGAGFLVEPYAAVTLPFLKTDVTELELSAHYPIVNGITPAVGPRAFLTLWFGGAGNDEEEEENPEKTDGEGDGEEMEDESEVETPSAVPTPTPATAPKLPSPKPQAKPGKKPVKKPIKKAVKTSGN